MKKTLFMVTFNIRNYALVLAFLGCTLAFAIHLSIDEVLLTLNLSGVKELIGVFIYINRIINLVKISCKITIMIGLFHIIVELIYWTVNDTIFNYIKSCWLTFRLRRFLVQNERSIKRIEITQVQTSNPIYADFNKAVRRSIVEISNNRAVIYIKLPCSQQAQKILKDMESQIKEELSNHIPNYYFSYPQREKNKFWYIGMPRK